jgi:DNA repair protein RecO
MSSKFKVFTGIVLRHIKYDEAEKLFIIITPTGKRKVFAKGVRKITSKNAGHLELFTHAHIQTVEGNSGRYIITDAVALDKFDALASHIEKYTLAMFACEMVDKYAQENDDTGYFGLLFILKYLRDSVYSQNDILLVLVRLSIAIGNTPDDLYYSYNDGGVICKNCKHNTCISLSLNNIKILRNAYRHQNNSMTYNIEKENIKYVSSLIYNQIMYNTHEKIVTWKMINDIVI